MRKVGNSVRLQERNGAMKRATTLAVGVLGIGLLLGVSTIGQVDAAQVLSLDQMRMVSGGGCCTGTYNNCPDPNEVSCSTQNPCNGNEEASFQACDECENEGEAGTDTCYPGLFDKHCLTRAPCIEQGGNCTSGTAEKAVPREGCGDTCS